MRKEMFAEGPVYHIYNRGTDKREVFGCEEDRGRFVNDLYFMNSEDHAGTSGASAYRNLFGEMSMVQRAAGKKIVDVLAFVLMPNHFHLVLTQRIPGGISMFMHKLGTAYTMYFNRKYSRSGVLFQGRFKAVLLKRAAHFNYLPFYVHANPLKLRSDIKDQDEKLDFLLGYKWSSFNDYAGNSRFPGIVSTGLLGDYFKEEGGFIDYIRARLKYSEAQPPTEAQPPKISI
jgi:putative transposase